MSTNKSINLMIRYHAAGVIEGRYVKGVREEADYRVANIAIKIHFLVEDSKLKRI